jgi:peptidyl-tRNA hydrolase
VTDYVLGKFSGKENEAIELVATAAARAAMCWVTDGVTLAMSRFNAGDKPNT